MMCTRQMSASHDNQFNAVEQKGDFLSLKDGR